MIHPSITFTACLFLIPLGALRSLGRDDLPVKGTVEQPVIALELGSEPATTPESGVLVCTGKITGSEGADRVATGADDVQVVHNGSGKWNATFWFHLPAGHPAATYTFWARWAQGGDPNVCSQTFEVWAGADETKLELRSKQQLKPTGWKATWVDGKPLTLKADDAVLEIRNSGAGQDAKVFDAFLLGGPKPPPPPVELPISGTKDKPVVALGFGKVPFNQREPDPAVLVHSGKVVEKPGADAAGIGTDVVTVIHKGFGDWGATFQFDLTEQPVPPGFYTFHARYMSGGEPSQVRQTFTVKAGPDASSLGVRGTFQTVNKTPFKHQWLDGKGLVAMFPGDRVLQVVNAGKAHDAKVFSGFVLGLARPLPDWMTAERALRRSRFLAAVRKNDEPTTKLYVVDGDGDDAVFDGLAEQAATAQVTYLLGEEADNFAQSLHLSVRPAAIVVNANRRVVSVTPGGIPAYPELKPSEFVALREGAPGQWLIATGWPGHCGVGHWGLDAESQQRPNPGDLYAYGFFTAGSRSGRWVERGVGASSVCVITEKLAESFAWGKCTSYAVAYLQVEQPVKTVLHLQHSGIESAVYLDGADQPLRADPRPPVRLARQQAKTAARVVERAGQETHDDVSVPQAAQPPLAASLELGSGWHCLVLKFVHGQGPGETVLFSARLTGADGVRSQTTDPTVSLSVAKAAVGLWPNLTLDGVPGNLPRPGEPLTLVADMGVLASYVGRLCPEAFLPFAATLRVRMTDYDGKEVRTFEAQGTFPSVVKLDLGPAPAAGYYALTPELYSADGRLICRFHPDGFSVVRGNAAQKERVDQKELMNSWYYAFNDWDTFAPWLERIGMFKNVGSTPGVSAKDTPAKWEDARRRGIVLFGDFAGDSNWMNNSSDEAEKVVALAPQFTRYFKSVNEIDGRWGGAEGVAWHAARNPAKWVERARWQHAAVHQARPDAVYFGGSLYCSGVDRKRTDHPDILGPRAWFRKCLELGLDKYVDAWDVHSYPQFPPRLEAPSASNSGNETDLGVLSVFQELGKTNTKPFLLGETSAMVWHGFAGLRWQAATLAKMTAWTNSREDWLGIALCAAHHNRRATMEEYGLAHNPGEAAAYTAGALIDGLPYKRFPTDDDKIQAAHFGDTFMIWRTDDAVTDWKMKLDGAGPWVIVNVVGQLRPLEVTSGEATFLISTSPFYVLTTENYQRLTR